jgi:hypothetical protein
MKKKSGDLTLREAKKYCDNRAKEKGGTYCGDCPLSKICGDYLDTFDEEDLDQEVEVEE